MSECLFCKIANGDIPARLAHQDEHLIVFHDINPQAPVHLLIVPRKHIPMLDDVSDADRELMGHILFTAQKLAAKHDIVGAYRVVNNCGAPAGQSVFHIHFHLLGGRAMDWPPG